MSFCVLFLVLITPFIETKQNNKSLFNTFNNQFSSLNSLNTIFTSDMTQKKYRKTKNKRKRPIKQTDIINNDYEPAKKRPKLLPQNNKSCIGCNNNRKYIKNDFAKRIKKEKTPNTPPQRKESRGSQSTDRTTSSNKSILNDDMDSDTDIEDDKVMNDTNNSLLTEKSLKRHNDDNDGDMEYDFDTGNIYENGLIKSKTFHAGVYMNRNRLEPTNDNDSGTSSPRKYRVTPKQHKIGQTSKLRYDGCNNMGSFNNGLNRESTLIKCLKSVSILGVVGGLCYFNGNDLKNAMCNGNIPSHDIEMNDNYSTILKQENESLKKQLNESNKMFKDLEINFNDLKINYDDSIHILGDKSREIETNQVTIQQKNEIIKKLNQQIQSKQNALNECYDEVYKCKKDLKKK